MVDASFVLGIANQSMVANYIGAMADYVVEVAVVGTLVSSDVTDLLVAVR